MSHRLPDQTHASLCPLCGAGNGCSMAQGKAASNCWCMRTPIASTQLALIAPGERGQRCICPACAQTFAAPSSPHTT